MINNNDCARATRHPTIYSPDWERLLQSLLSTLADIDFSYESDIEVVRASDADETVKRNAIEKLQQQHRVMREPYVRRLEKLEARVSAGLFSDVLPQFSLKCRGSP